MPCPKETYFDVENNDCVECLEGFICPVGSQEPLDPKFIIKEKELQPLNFQKSSVGYTLIIFASVFSFTILIFIILFFTTLIFKIVLGYYNLFKNDNDASKNDKSNIEDNAKDVDKISYTGGFFTGIAIIVIIFNFIYLIINYRLHNEKETRSLILLSSLLQEQDYNSNHIQLEVYMYSYRGNCSNLAEVSSDDFSISYAEIYEEIVGENSTLCTHIINVDFDELFKSDASLEMRFLGYTSDIALTVSAESGNPGEKSSFTQVLASSDGDVIIGIEPSLFTISLIPAYFSHEGYFGDPYENLGLRMGGFSSPIIGSVDALENIYLSTGFKIKTQFLLSEFGVTTYRYQDIDPITFFIAMMATPPGLIGLVGLFLKFYEIVINKFKKKDTVTQEVGISEIYNKKNNIKKTDSTTIISRGMDKSIDLDN